MSDDKKESQWIHDDGYGSGGGIFEAIGALFVLAYAAVIGLGVLSVKVYSYFTRNKV